MKKMYSKPTADFRALTPAGSVATEALVGSCWSHISEQTGAGGPPTATYTTYYDNDNNVPGYFQVSVTGKNCGSNINNFDVVI